MRTRAAQRWQRSGPVRSNNTVSLNLSPGPMRAPRPVLGASSDIAMLRMPATEAFTTGASPPRACSCDSGVPGGKTPRHMGLRVARGAGQPLAGGAA